MQDFQIWIDLCSCPILLLPRVSSKAATAWNLGWESVGVLHILRCCSSPPQPARVGAAASLQGTTSHSHHFLPLYLPSFLHTCPHSLPRNDEHSLPRFSSLSFGISFAQGEGCSLAGRWAGTDGRMDGWMDAGGWVVVLTQDSGAASQGRLQSSRCSSPWSCTSCLSRFYCKGSFSLEGRRFLSILLRDFGSSCSDQFCLTEVCKKFYVSVLSSVSHSFFCSHTTFGTSHSHSLQEGC